MFWDGWSGNERTSTQDRGSGGWRLLPRPLDLDNLSRRDIPQYINGAWFGWHAFRRGLGTKLNETGVDDTEIQSILRHPDFQPPKHSIVRRIGNGPRRG
jgi:hypothetical protein